MITKLYQCLVFGTPRDEQIASFRTTFGDALRAFGLVLDKDASITVGVTPDFVATVPTVAVFFGGPAATLDEHADLVRLSIPILPLVSSASAVPKELPECIRPINALAIDKTDTQLITPVSAALQCLGLLPAQRRVFISYRRDDAREVAVQLFEALSARQFDVFLDTHSVATGTEFQTMLWHRLCDSDVVIMLDTPGYFESRWTTKEWGRAIDKHISMLQVVWPGHSASRLTRLATQLQLDTRDFTQSQLSDEVITSVCIQVETLRSKSIALRHANIVGGLRVAIEDLGGSIEGLGRRRSVVLRLPSGAPLVAYPSVGVPTAVTLHEAVADAEQRPAVLIYDHVGLSEEWMTHLKWLGANVTSVRWLRSRMVGWDLADLEEL